MDKANTFYIIKRGTNEIKWIKQDMPFICDRSAIKRELLAYIKHEKDMMRMEEEVIGSTTNEADLVGISIRLYEETFGPLR